MRQVLDSFVRSLIAGVAAMLVLPIAVEPAFAGGSWFSKVRRSTQPVEPTAPGVVAIAADSGVSVFDLVISLYNDPAGDDDPNNDLVGEEQIPYENIVRFWADAVCEQSNGAQKLGRVRFFRNGAQGSLADVVWNASEWPRAMTPGFGNFGLSITFGDVFPDGLCLDVACTMTADIDFLDPAEWEGAGYTLGHEFGHYVYALRDEYAIEAGDVPVDMAIMNSQWNAVGGGAFEWLNHSTENNYEEKTAQGRVYGKSGWEVLIQPTEDDPRAGDRDAQPVRTRYTELVGREPNAGDGWFILELPAGRADCRNELELIWMQSDIEMQVVLDRSSSMEGDPLSNAKQAASNLVDGVAEGETSLGVVAFNANVDQVQEIIPVPNQDTKEDIKGVIADIESSGRTAFFDAARLALDNLVLYATNEGTNAAQLVFLLSDGLDNESSETQASVTIAYQDAEVPLSTFAYGSFAPDGVLRQLAEDTGGIFRFSPTDLAEIQSSFLAATAALTSSAGVLQASLAVPGSGSADFPPFAVDAMLRELALFVVHDGDPADLSFALSSPAGAAAVSFACTGVAGSTSCSAVVDESTLAAGGIGTWRLSASNNSGSARSAVLDIVANPFPGRTFDLVVAPLDGSLVSYPQPIVVTANVSEARPITNVELTGTITSPSGLVRPLPFFDDGTNGDGIAEDGRYSAITGYDANGVHTIRVTVDNTALTGRFTMEAFDPAHPSANSGGQLPSAPALPPILQPFTRTASTQIVVSGFTSDDHPNAPPGTNAAPDNTDVPGRIDFAGDPDVFSVNTSGLDHLVFRVTGLALGMEPRLTVLASDGSPIVSATIDQLVEGAGYLALELPVKGNSVMHAQVTHATGGTGNYLFSAGPRIFTDPPLVAIDVKPDSRVNPVNPMSEGKLPVAILGSEIVDLRLIDSSTLALGADGAPATHPRGGVFSDVDGDLLEDYLNHYRVPATGVAFGDDEICLSGEIDGVPFEACDSIWTVPACGIGFELALLLPPILWAYRRRARVSR